MRSERSSTDDIAEILKQPLHTSVAIDTLEFSEFKVEDKLHIVISVKDFKTIVLHAGSTRTTVSAAYSNPSRPMQLKYTDEGMSSEFILMTLGDFRGSSVTPAPGAARSAIAKAQARQPLEASSNRNGGNPTTSMPPPSRSVAPSVARENSRPRIRRPSPPPPQPSLHSESLFFPDPDEDDQRWDPVNYDEEDEEPLGWDASADNVNLPSSAQLAMFQFNYKQDRPKMTLSRSTQQLIEGKSQSINNHTSGSGSGSLNKSTQRLAPTQNLSSVNAVSPEI